MHFGGGLNYRGTILDTHRVEGGARVGVVEVGEGSGIAHSTLVGMGVIRTADPFVVSMFVAITSHNHHSHPQADEQQAEQKVCAVSVLNDPVPQVLIRFVTFVFRVVFFIFVLFSLFY